MKKLSLLFVLFTLASLTSNLNSQEFNYFTIHFIQVPQENVSEVARLETTYWSKVAQSNIDSGKQSAWGLVARVGGGSDSWTHAFMNVYETAEQMAAASSNYDSKAILGIDPQDIATFDYIEGYGLTHWALRAFIPGYADFTVWNFGKPLNAVAFVNEQTNVWQPAFEKNMGGREYWGAALKINNVTEEYSTVLTMDGYETLAEAFRAMNGEIPNQPNPRSKVSEIMPDGFSARVIVETLIWLTN